MILGKLANVMGPCQGSNRSRWYIQIRIIGGGYSQRDSFLWVEYRELQGLVEEPRAGNHPRLERMRSGSPEEERAL